VKIAFHTLGCRANQYETDKMIQQVCSYGYEVVPYPQAADIYVINTCTVTAIAARKSRNTARHAKKLNPKAKVIFIGCDAEIESIPEADLVLSNKDKLKIGEVIKEMTRRETRDANPLSSPISQLPSLPVRANLMIEDGCENFCSYCIVPIVRGKIKVRPMDEVINEAKIMIERGAKEIVLTGINLGAYGMEPEAKSLGSSRNRDFQSQVPTLLRKLASLDGLLRIRLSSIEPMYVTDELIKVIKTEPKVAHHLHIPLQSGDDGVLKAMNRTYTSNEFLALINKVKKQIKDIAITTDIIVGFPGEDEKAFINSCKLAEKIKFSKVHVFPYSDRPKTKAFTMPGKCRSIDITKRAKKLGVLADKLMLSFNKSYKGKKLEILVEQRNKRTGLLEGLTGNYIRVALTNGPRTNEPIGTIVGCSLQNPEADIALCKLS
jgi:threonylcarbamoyladenosine tRNA methylthiotransferase MtaB